MASDITAGSQQTGTARAELADRARTVLVTCGAAHDAEDARVLLDALGVNDHESLTVAKALARLR